VLFLLSDAGGMLTSLSKFEDSVICGRSRVKANLSKILEIVFKFDMGLKLAGTFTSIPAFFSSGETWASLNGVGKRDVSSQLVLRSLRICSTRIY